jgi:hypothetical protein
MVRIRSGHHRRRRCVGRAALRGNVDQHRANTRLAEAALQGGWERRAIVLPLLLGIWLVVPGQGTTALGLEVLATGLVCGGLLLWLIRPSNRSGEGTTFWLLGSLLPSLALTALTVVGGTTLIIGHGGGLYWLAPAVVIAFATGLAGAWVLLVEILR